MGEAVAKGLDDPPLEVDSRVCGEYCVPITRQSLIQQAEISSSPSPRTSVSTPPVTSAISGRLCHGVSSVLCKEIASHTTSAVESSMPLARKKSRAAFAPSTSNRWSWLRYFGVSPKSCKIAPEIQQLVIGGGQLPVAASDRSEQVHPQRVSEQQRRAVLP